MGGCCVESARHAVFAQKLSAEFDGARLYLSRWQIRDRIQGPWDLADRGHQTL
jgi:hypothetical protein